jgi:hypothetical protein
VDQSQAVFQLIGNCFLVWAALVGTASVAVHLRVPWWYSVMGRHLMAYMCVFAVVLDLGVVKLIIGDSWGFQLLRLITFTGVPIVMTWRLLLQIKAQHAARTDPIVPPRIGDEPRPDSASP